MKTTYGIDYYPSMLLAWLALTTIVTFASLGRAIDAAQFTLS